MLYKEQQQFLSILLPAIAKALETGELSIDGVTEVTSFVQSYLPTVFTHEEEDIFLWQLIQRWPWFASCNVAHALDKTNDSRTQIELLANAVFVGSSR